MQVELVRVKTSDGIRLDGAYVQSSSPSQATGCDAVILVHGVGGNFYASTMIETICDTLQRAGISTLRVNTRGHDGVSTAATDAGGKLFGAAYEIVADCRQDLSAWIELLRQRGYQRIGLMGHSLGALKVVFAQATQPQPCVVKVIAVSPPRLSFSRFQRGPSVEAFQSSWQTAQHWLQAGQPQMLFMATFPFPLVLSAATFVDKYGPEERYNLLQFANHVPCSTEYVFGGRELVASNAAFVGLPDELSQLAWQIKPLISTIIEADHFYTGCHAALADRVLQASQVV
ncbi:MAG: alpha/beta fold hydrolase [Planctomycetales bacterium]|nr:alpha/beta fold hydrolase [Planctomycetales bacterium]